MNILINLFLAIFIAPVSGAVKAVKRKINGKDSSSNNCGVCIPDEARQSEANKQLESESQSSESQT